MSSMNIPEVEMTLDPPNGESPNSSFQSIPNSISSNEHRIPTVYICGLLRKRYHNQAIYAIAHDLMPEFFVATNPIQANRWNADRIKSMLAQTDVLLFLLNESTVADHRCLLTLQYSWELHVPIVMLRQPRVRLIIKPAAATATVPKSIHAPDDPTKPNMTLLQDIIYESYKHSIEYDRNNHLAGMRKMVNHLRQTVERSHQKQGGIVEGLQISTTTIKQPHFFLSDDNHLKLPHIPSPPHSLVSGPVLRCNTAASVNLMRSRSLGNLQKEQGDKESHLGRGKRTNTSAVWSKRNGHHHAAIRTTSAYAKNDIYPSPSADPLCPLQSTDDPSLYHETQYLIFPLRDKGQKPRLIRFPSALTDSNTQETGSIWGSDTSLEEEAERAEAVQGGLDVHTPPGSPAPYIAPL